MAMVKCKECGNQVSTKAKACPTCGAAQPKRTSVLTWVAAGLIGLIVIVSIATKEDPVSAPAPKAAPTAADVKADRQWAAVAAAQLTVQKGLKDPDSAKFEGPVYHEPGYVCGRVNAKNSFGGYSGWKGFVLEVDTPRMLYEERDKEFLGIWNKHCVTR